MEKLESILSPSGGINLDDSLICPPGRESAFENGDYRYSRGLHIGTSVEDHLGGAETIASTLEINNYYTWNGSAFVSDTAPAGNMTTRGKFQDKDEGVLYYAVYNDAGNHLILKFVKSERRIYELLKWSGLNFSATAYISMCRINTYLILTSNEIGSNGVANPPRCINTTTINATKYTLGANFSEYHISMAKWPPLAPPQTTWFGTTPGDNIQINKGLFQFSYRYIYNGGLKSTWSPPSQFFSLENATTHYSDAYIRVNVPGFIHNYGDTTQVNWFQHDSIKFFDVVQYIEFGYRQSLNDPWKFFKRLTVTVGSNNYVDFTNIGSQGTIADTDIGQYFDSVPFFSGTCEAIDNRPIFADNTDDLSVSEIAVTTPRVESGPGYQPTFDASYSNISATDKTILQNQTNLSRYTFKEGGIYKAGILWQHYNGRTSLVQTADNWTFNVVREFPSAAVSENFHALGFDLSSITPPDWAVGYQIVRSNCLNIEFFITGLVNDFIYIKDNSPTSALTVMPDNARNILNDYLNSQANNSLVPISQRLANSYRKSQTAFGTTASQIYIDIENWITSYSQVGGIPIRSNNVYYNFQKGDRVRFTAISIAGPQKVYDEEIVDYTGTGIIINVPENTGVYGGIGASGLYTRQSPPPAGTTNAIDEYRFAIEIYRPKPYNPSDKVLFYEIGEWYPIKYARTANRELEKKLFNWTNAAAVIKTADSYESITNFNFFNNYPVTNGDAHYTLKRFYYKPTTAFPNGYYDMTFVCMNQDKDKAAGFWEHNTGKPLLAYAYPPILLDKPGQARFGGKFLEDSVFVNINRFRDADQFVYPSEYGRIRRMINTSNAQVESVGNVLLMLGEAESWSVYVNRTTLEDLSGRTQVSLSDRVLGSYNTLLGSQGTLNPESVYTHKGRVIWWNAKKACWNRYSRDGITEISEIKMKNWFRDLSDLLISTYASTPPWIQAVYDNYHDEWITRFDHSSLPGTFKGYDSYKCVSFAERPSDKRWKSVYDYAPDMFAALDNEVYSLKGYKVHIHEAGADFCSIYGGYYPPQIEFASTDFSRMVKDPRVVALMATDKWSFEKIMGDWKSNSATIQQTRILITSLDKREGVYWADIKKDQNSPNAGSTANAVVNGNPMKVNTLRLFMQLDPAVNYLSVLHWLSVEYDLSAKNPKN